MKTILLVLFFFLLAFVGLAIGVLFGNKRLRGGCGGLGKGDCKEKSGACSCKDEKPR